MGIVLVKVWRAVSDAAIIIQQALLDSCGSTFLTESTDEACKFKNKDFLDHLGKKNVQLRALSLFIAQDLVISDQDENNFMGNVSTLPVHTRAEILVTKEDIPTQEEICQWSDTSGILPNINSEISFIVLSDVTETFGPLEVKNSQDGSTYASRTRIS